MTGVLLPLVGMGVLAGWAFDIPTLRSVLPGLVNMNPVTAVCFILAGASLLMLREGRGRKSRVAGRVAASLIVAVGAIKLASYASRLDVGIDAWLFADKLALLPSHNPIAANTAFNFVLVGSALLLLDAPVTRWPTPAPVLASISLIVGGVTVIGYLLGEREFQGFSTKFPMALHTGLCFILLGIGLHAVRPHRGIARAILADDEGARLMRRLLPFAVSIPLAVTVLRLAGERAGMFGTPLGIAIAVVVNSLVFTTLVLVQGRSLSLEAAKRAASDRERAKSEHLLKEAEVSARTGGTELMLSTREVRWSPGMFAVFGLDPTAGVPAPATYLTRFHPDDRPLLAGLREELFRTPHAIDFEARVLQADGSYHWIHLRGEVVRDAQGEPQRVIVTVQDIHERKEAAEALERARKEAESAALAKATFLANMSHEIRTPMNAVVGMTELLLDTPLTQEQREYVETIQVSGDHLLTVINDVLDFSKIEAGKIELEECPFDLRIAIEGALDLVTQTSRAKGLELGYMIAPGTPTMPVGDVGRFRQVLVNLLSNAVKFTKQGEVVVEVDAVPAMGGKHEFRIAVRDTGVGIPPDSLDRLFKSFSQADASTTRTFGGTGLGLAISKRLCELMGGDITVESVPQKGSTFRFSFLAPSVEPPRKARQRLDAAGLAGLRVLIVDDNATNRYILDAQTRAWGMLPRQTGDPREALAWIQAGDPFDLAIVDHDMPEMDGFELAAEIRRHRDAPALPLVLLSSAGATARAGNALFQAQASKPIKQSGLFDVIVDVLHNTRVATPVPAPLSASSPKEARPLRILLAEDQVINQRVAVSLLRKLGYRSVDIVSNGREAVEAVARTQYDVVLMDMQMPEMDGLEATRTLCAQWPRATRPRIIAMTANALPGDKEMCLAAGMDDYIAKPIQSVVLSRALAAVTPALAAAPLPREALAQEDADLTALRADLDDEAAVADLVRTFLDHAPTLLRQLEEALAVGDAQAAAKHAHALKGSASPFGAKRLVALALEVEALARAGSMEEARSRGADVAEAFARLRQEWGTAASPSPEDGRRVPVAEGTSLGELNRRASGPR